MEIDTERTAGEDAMMLLEDKVAIVTGAASARGIGKQTARRFSEAGCRIAIVDLDSEASIAAANDIGSEHRGYGCDVASPTACQGLARQVLDDFGKIDILVNYAGISQPDRIMEVTQERYDAVMNVNVRGTLNMCQAVIPHMRSRKQGNIVTIGSVAAQRGGGLFGGPHYAASKGAVQSMAKSLARELAPDGIRVNAIAPGTIDTDIFQGKLTDEKKKAIAIDVPLGRLGTADDIAKACLFLVCDLSGYITGTVLDVNGGLLIHH
jgi:NAD(P)-dependent dehydrogenase (short-subunit alcohol dehydrogenase family)